MPNKLNLTKELDAIAANIYKSVLNHFDIQSPEYYSTASKIRQGITDSYFYIAQAEGSYNKGASEYEWNYARKFLSGLKAILIFAQNQKMVPKNPRLITKMNKIIKEVDNRLKLEIIAKNEFHEEELKPWLEKYRLWKKINNFK